MIHLRRQGYIITAAGLIMAVAFGGLFTSDEKLLNQVRILDEIINHIPALSQATTQQNKRNHYMY